MDTSVSLNQSFDAKTIAEITRLTDEVLKERAEFNARENTPEKRLGRKRRATLLREVTAEGRSFEDAVQRLTTTWEYPDVTLESAFLDLELALTEFTAKKLELARADIDNAKATAERVRKARLGLSRD